MARPLLRKALPKSIRDGGTARKRARPPDPLRPSIAQPHGVYESSGVGRRRRRSPHEDYERTRDAVLDFGDDAGGWGGSQLRGSPTPTPTAPTTTGVVGRLPSRAQARARRSGRRHSDCSPVVSTPKRATHAPATSWSRRRSRW